MTVGKLGKEPNSQEVSKRSIGNLEVSSTGNPTFLNYTFIFYVEPERGWTSGGYWIQYRILKDYDDVIVNQFLL